MTTSDGKNEPDLDQYDTPTDRATINRVHVDELDAWLEVLRDRRLQTVRKLEHAAKVRADEVRLSAFLRYQTQYERAKRALTKADEALAKAEGQVHKARLLAMAAELEVTEIDHADNQGTSQSA